MSRRRRVTEIPPISSDLEASETKRMKATDSDNSPVSMDAPTCCKCSRVTMGESSSCFVLGCSAECRVCANCFSHMVLCLAETSIMTCPCCDIAIDSWDAEYPIERKRRSGVSIVMEASKFLVPKISPKLDPLRFHANMPSPKARDELISISVSSSRDGIVCSLSEHFLLHSDCNERWSLVPRQMPSWVCLRPRD
jgi:hypothetical protein